MVLLLLKLAVLLCAVSAEIRKWFATVKRKYSTANFSKLYKSVPKKRPQSIAMHHRFHRIFTPKTQRGNTGTKRARNWAVAFERNPTEKWSKSGPNRGQYHQLAGTWTIIFQDHRPKVSTAQPKSASAYLYASAGLILRKPDFWSSSPYRLCTSKETMTSTWTF